MPQLLYFAHLLSLSHIQSQNIVCQYWGRCAHVQNIDTQLNIAMRTVSGAGRPTNIRLLLCSATSSPHRFTVTVLPCSLQEGSAAHGSFYHQGDPIREPPKSRLRSRRPFVIDYARLASLNQPVQDMCEQSWSVGVPPGNDLVANPTCPQPGLTLPRRQFITLNRLRCGQARCAESIYRWGKIASPACPCGVSHHTRPQGTL